MKTSRYYQLLSIIPGVILAQLISTGIVYHSNIQLYQKLDSIITAGYFPIPNQHIIPLLKSFKTSFFGGLFFTCTIGIFLIFITYCLIFMRNRIKTNGKKIDVIIGLGWILSMMAVHVNGFCPQASIFLFAIPLWVWMVSVRFPLNSNHAPLLTSVRRFVICYGLFLAMLVLGIHQYGIRIFSGFRDFFLLSNPIGQFINSFYYNYTLYPAEVFKSLNQKQLKTCKLENISDQCLTNQLELLLIRNDYLVVSNVKSPDLIIKQYETSLIFNDCHNKPVLRIDVRHFLQYYKKVLSDYSKKTDRYRIFRKLTFIALITNLSLLLFIIIFLPFGLCYQFLLKKQRVLFFYIICVLVVGIMSISGYLYFQRFTVTPHDLPHMLTSNDWKQQVVALEYIWNKKIDITTFSNWQELVSSSHIPVRYWITKAFGISSSQDITPYLFTLLNDSNLNVVYAAFDTFGKRGDRYAIDIILKRIQQSDHWYTQWYAYRALKRLGWHQTKNFNLYRQMVSEK